MTSQFLSRTAAGSLAVALSFSSPAFAFRGGGFGGHMGGGGFGGGAHMGGAPTGAMHMGAAPMGGFAAPGPGRFAAAPFLRRPGFSPHVNRFAFDNRFRHHRFRHIGRFAVFGAPVAYAGYSDCWRQAWTRFGWQWIDVCRDYDGDFGY